MKPPVVDTFSANSLKLLEKSVEEFKMKYIENLYFTPDNKQAKAGQNLHSFLCFYLKNFDTSKLEAAFGDKDREFIEKIKKYDEIQTLKSAREKFIEQPFLIKCTPESTAENAAAKQDTPVFYLTGRFDAILAASGKIQIFDWKTQNLPQNPNTDIQTVVYLYSASKLYKTENVSIKYISLTKNESIEIKYDKGFDKGSQYFEKIRNLVSKLY